MIPFGAALSAGGQEPVGGDGFASPLVNHVGADDKSVSSEIVMTVIVMTVMEESWSAVHAWQGSKV